MATYQDAPITDPVIEFGSQKVNDDAFGKPRLSWIKWFQGVTQGDIGTRWAPVPTNLTTSGTPTITGAYYQNQGFTDFWIRIVPGTNTSSTGGTTYFQLPFNVTVDGACHAVSGLLGSNAGMVDAVTDRCYPPSWSAVTVPLTIVGRVVTH